MTSSWIPHNKLPTIVTNHLESQLIVTAHSSSVIFPSTITHIKGQELDYHLFHVAHPTEQHNHPLLPFSIVNASHDNHPLTCDLAHQCLAHACYDILYKRCADHTMMVSCNVLSLNAPGHVLFVLWLHLVSHLMESSLLHEFYDETSCYIWNFPSGIKFLSMASLMHCTLWMWVIHLCSGPFLPKFSTQNK